ncbi:MAG TPA: BON domain-containing protein [Acidobacteriaceae bacterium]|nr:BON domain-containing protein [Acidobacteriaceae bacterium]
MQKIVRSFHLALAVACAGLVLSLPAHAQSSAQPDNSAQNKNQNPGGTADNQPNATSDRQTTANVRKAIIADKDLSTYAHNVKIITKGGTVTLKGPVKSDDEKQKVVSDAASVVSADKVVDQLTVKQ